MDIYFIAGTLISIVLTYWGVWHQERTKKRVHLSIVDRLWLALVSTNANYFNSLKIEDYQLPVNTNHYYYSGIIINSGNVDIYKSIILQPLKISFENDINILHAKLTQTNIGTEVQISNDVTSISLEWDILKPLEHFTFDIIIESRSGLPLYNRRNHMKIFQRIAELTKVDHLSMYELKSSKQNFFKEVLPTYAFILFLFLFPLLGLISGIKSFYRTKETFRYDITWVKNKQHVELEYYNKDSLKLSSNKESKIIPIENLNQQVQISTTLTIVRNQYFKTTACAVAIMLVILILRMRARDDMKNRQLQKILSSLKAI